jgi:hypothetical protein
MGQNILNTENFRAAITLYEPKVVAVSAGTDVFGIDTLRNVVNNNFPPGVWYYNNPAFYYILRLPYARLLGLQVLEKNNHNQKSGEISAVSVNIDEYSTLLHTILSRFRDIASQNDTKIVVFYHPHLLFNKDGSVSPNTDPLYLSIFKKACIENDIYFVDMTKIFLDEYYTRHRLPYGFANTAVGAGHMNKNGHRMIANELFKRINEIEKDGSQ